MNTSTLASLAILKVNYDRRGQDYIDNFVPFVVEGLRQARATGSTPAQAQSFLQRDFGISIPQGAISSILRRAARKGLAQPLGNGFFAITAVGEHSQDLAAARERAVREERALVDRLVIFSGQHLAAAWSAEEAERALLRLATERGARVLASIPFPEETGRTAKDENHLVGEFVLLLRQRDPEGFGYLETLIKGALLANAMYYPDIGRLQSKFERLDVYLDTRFVLRALGTAGKEHEAATQELLDLLFELGAGLRVFDNTLLELKGVLGAAANALRHPGGLRFRSGETLEYLASIGSSSSDVELLSAQLPRRLASLRVTVRDRPTYTNALGVDEERLEQSLREGRSGTRRPYPEDALRHDVAALTAVHRLRAGRVRPVLETAGAVFLTTNALLARTGIDFFRDHYGVTGVPLCFADHHFATLAWLKKPTAAPTLPQLFVIADSYAALNPPDNLWRAYLAEIARLEDRGDISDDDYFALRFTTAAKTALVDVDEEGKDAIRSVPEILARTRAAIRAEVQAEMSQDGARPSPEVVEVPEGADQVRAAAEADRVRREASFRATAVQVGQVIAGLLLALGTVAIAFVLYLTSAPVLPQLPQDWIAPYLPIIYVVGFAILVLGVANLVFGTSLRSVTRGVEIRVSRRVEAFLRARFG